MARRHKPKSPEQIAAEKLERRRQAMEAVNMQPEAAGLVAHAETHIERTGRKSGRNRAWRSNVFRLLLERKAITPSHYDAAQRLIEQWAAWKGLDGKPETFGEVVDGGGGSAELVTDRMIKGGRQVSDILGHLDPLSRVILEHFMVATVEEDRPMAWRGIMQRVGIVSRDKQTACVVGALEALRVAYEAPRERVAA